MCLLVASLSTIIVWALWLTPPGQVGIANFTTLWLTGALSTGLLGSPVFCALPYLASLCHEFLQLSGSLTYRLSLPIGVSGSLPHQHFFVRLRGISYPQSQVLFSRFSSYSVVLDTSVGPHLDSAPTDSPDPASSFFWPTFDCLPGRVFGQFFPIGCCVVFLVDPSIGFFGRWVGFTVGRWVG